MAQNKLKPSSLHLTRHHINKPSVDTNASGVTESAISYSAFPEPPSSIPATPVRSVFGSPGPSLTNTHVLILPRHSSPPLIAGSIASTSNRYSHSTLDQDSTHPLTSQAGKRDRDDNSVSASSISPYDWHEGASSIDVDATEDRLLPTSFITSLLRENAGPHGTNRASYSSDAISNISEMTYPPKNPFTDSLRNSSTLSSHNRSRRQSQGTSLPRPVGGRSPNSLAYSRKGRNSGGSDGHGSRISMSAIRSLPRSDHSQNLTKSGFTLSQSTLVPEQLEWGGKPNGQLAVYSEVDEYEEESRVDTQIGSPPGFATSRTNLAQKSLGNFDSRLRESIHSTRSAAPSFKSRISSLRSITRAFTWRRKPLPPLPTSPHISVTIETEREREKQTPLPDLVNRANRLHGLLEKGYHPHESMVSCPTKNEQSASSLDIPEHVQSHSGKGSRRALPMKFCVIAWLKANKPWAILGILVIIAIIAIGSGVGVTAQRNKIRASSCPANRAGVNCSLNATCVCMSPSSSLSSCDSPVGQAILDVVPVMNKVFSTNITLSTVYNSLWIAQGSIQGSNCADQVNLIDVGPELDVARQPNRTQWAQSALLWTLTQTLDPGPMSQLQNFVQKAPWSQAKTPDGPISGGSAFTVDAAGYTYDFGAQKVTPIPATFVSEGQPQQDQISRVESSLRAPLDNIYSYAVASSKQQDSALLQYWTQILHQTQDRLKSFQSAFSSSSIILPFDATSQAIQNLYDADSFPPPIACYPGLQPDQLQLVNAVEGTAFGLPKANVSTQFDTTCFPARPTYGILDLLNLRLPFPDSLGETSRQGIILNSDVAPRAILAVGEVLSALPASTNATRSLAADMDPRSYGTPTYASHIILQYLSSMPTNTANAVISHVLDTPSPTPIDSIPILEVAVFGNIEASDTSSYISSFTSPSGSLFFGSSSGSAFRNWAIGRGGQIAWAENATSAEVVYDKSFSDYIFNQTWFAASVSITTNAPNVSVANITDTFQKNQRFSP